MAVPLEIRMGRSAPIEDPNRRPRRVITLARRFGREPSGGGKRGPAARYHLENKTNVFGVSVRILTLPSRSMAMLPISAFPSASTQTRGNTSSVIKSSRFAATCLHMLGDSMPPGVQIAGLTGPGTILVIRVAGGTLFGPKQNEP